MRVRRAVLALAAILLSGCAVVPAPDFAVVWLREAVVDWAFAGKVLAVHVRFEAGAGDSLRLVVRDEKGKLLTLVRAGGTWFATGSLAGLGWRGTWNTAPPELAGWLCFSEALDGAMAAPDGESEFRTGRLSVRYFKSGGELRAMELSTVATDDRFRARF